MYLRASSRSIPTDAARSATSPMRRFSSAVGLGFSGCCGCCWGCSTSACTSCGCACAISDESYMPWKSCGKAARRACISATFVIMVPGIFAQLLLPVLYSASGTSE